MAFYCNNNTTFNLLAQTVSCIKIQEVVLEFG